MANLFDILNRSNYDFYFLVVDEFLDIDIPELSHFYSLSPQKLKISLDRKNSGRLLSHPAVLNFIKTNSLKTGRQPAIIPFKPSAKIDLICHQNNWILVGNPTPLNRLLEDKIKFPAICEKYRLSQIPYLILPFSENSFSTAQKQFGSDLVLQTHFGWAGNSSFLTPSFPQASKKFVTDQPIKFSPFKNIQLFLFIFENYLNSIFKIFDDINFFDGATPADLSINHDEYLNDYIY